MSSVRFRACGARAVWGSWSGSGAMSRARGWGLHERSHTMTRWTMLRTFHLIDVAALSTALLVAACSDSNAPTAPTGQFRSEMITCQVAVRAGTLTCAASQPQPAPLAHGAPGMSFNLIVGGQGALVRLASTGTSYNSVSQVLSSSRPVKYF